MKTLLFLDDIRSPSWVHWMKLPSRCDGDWTIVRNFSEFQEHILLIGVPDFISFDHDLDMEGIQDSSLQSNPTHASPQGEPSGMMCAKWLVEYCLDNHIKCPDFAVHSQNPAGRANIEGLLDGFAKFQLQEATNIAPGLKI